MWVGLLATSYVRRTSEMSPHSLRGGANLIHILWTKRGTGLCEASHPALPSIIFIISKPISNHSNLQNNYIYYYTSIDFITQLKSIYTTIQHFQSQTKYHQ